MSESGDESLPHSKGFSTDRGVVWEVGIDRLTGTNGNRLESKEGKLETA